MSKTLVRIPVGLRRAFDVVAIVALMLASYAARRGSLPFDGLWFDDSWVAAGAIHGRLSALLTDGSGTPGFTGLLMIVHRFGGGQLRDLGIPSLVAGVVAPSLLYVALRRFGYERSIAAIVSAVLVVARVHILYSGRVKGYTFDTVWVLLLLIVLPYLARRTWRWPLAVAWIVCSVAIGTFSAYTMVAAAGAAVVLVLHPSSDRVVRVGAVGVQAIAQLVYLGIAEKKADLAGIEKVLGGPIFDAHMNFSWNPITLAQESLTHLRRVAQVFPGGSGGWLTLFGLLAIAGLVAAATTGRRRPQRIAARYLLLLVTIAFVGSFSHVFPFGPTNTMVGGGDDTGMVGAGGRHTLWLIPAMALGLAEVAHRVRRVSASLDTARLAFDAIAVATAAAIVFVGYKPAPPAPYPGSQSATRYVETSIRPGDVVIVTSTSTFSFADSATTPVSLVPTPKHVVGFAPVFRDPRIHIIGGWAVTPGTPAEIRRWVRDADRVFVVTSGPLPDSGVQTMAGVLQPRGFRMQPHAFEWNSVFVWRRIG